MKWFNNPQTLEELKKQYKKLALANHPDRGGNTQNMQDINSEYDKLFEQLKNKHTAANGETYTKETAETINEFKDIINKIINLDGVNIEICGSWIWLTGNTYNYRTVLKELKFRFSNNKKAWYYHNEEYHKRGKKSFTLDEIRDLYGSETVIKNQNTKLKAM